MHRTVSSDSLHGPSLGLPDDPAGDLDELMDEVKQEVEMRRQRGQSISEGVKEAFQERVDRVKRVQRDVAMQKGEVGERQKGL